MTPEQMKKKIEELSKRTQAVRSKKATLKGQLQAKREELERLVKEIRAAGYDPFKLAEERNKKKAEVEAAIASFEKDLTEVEQALAKFEKKD
jgi:uncharacterized protein YoxC